MRTNSKGTMRIAGGLAIAGSLALPALASGHATVSPLQPQGKALTSARTTYVVRAPNEKANQDTWRMVMQVPPAVQERISFRKEPGWTTRLVKRDTGRKDTEGAPIFAVTRVSWTAKPGYEIPPKFFGEWFIRFQNPATPMSLSFPIAQWYTPKPTGKKPKRGQRRRGKPDIVRWIQPPGGEFPASVVNIVAE